MIGAIIGDLVGSVYEFNNIKTKEFPLINENSYPTDDSVMTLAVAEICQKNLSKNREDIINTIKKWGQGYPDAGYGSKFYYWVLSNNPKPYNSCGNGSAMRVSACGWYGRNEEEVKELSRAVTEVTHNHPEGIKGAEVTAMCIYYARIGKSKEFIKNYVSRYYDLNFDYDELVRTYKHEQEICQNTVPQAIFCFLISNSFEDCLRTTISIGGDCDTTAAISCAIAEAYYKDISCDLETMGLNKAYEWFICKNNRLGQEAKEIIKEFQSNKALLQVTQEEIENDSLIVCHSKTINEKTSFEWGNTKSLNAIKYYLANSKELVKKYVSENKNFYNIEDIKELNFILKNLYADFDEDIIVFNSPSQAIDYLRNNFEFDIKLFENLFFNDDLFLNEKSKNKLK